MFKGLKEYTAAKFKNLFKFAIRNNKSAKFTAEECPKYTTHIGK